MYIMILFPGQWLLLTSNVMVRGKKAGGLGREVVCYCLEQTEEGQFIINLKKKGFLNFDTFNFTEEEDLCPH